VPLRDSEVFMWTNILSSLDEPACKSDVAEHYKVKRIEWEEGWSWPMLHNG
jgi:hypothetical protein